MRFKRAWRQAIRIGTAAVAGMAAGIGAAAAGPAESPLQENAAEAPMPRFTDITREAGITFRHHSAPEKNTSLSR